MDNNLSLGLDSFAHNENLQKSFDNDLEKAVPIGTVNKYGKIKTAEGWVYQKKGKGAGTSATKEADSKPKANKTNQGITPEGGKNSHHAKKEEGKVGGSKSKTSEDVNGDKVSVGDKVKIPSNLTTDPNKKQGQAGEITGIRDGGSTVTVKFSDGSTGNYSDGAFEKQSKVGGDKKNSTFEQVLADPEGKEIVEGIEGLDSSRADHKTLYADYKKQLKDKFGYDYKVSENSTQQTEKEREAYLAAGGLSLSKSDVWKRKPYGLISNNEIKSLGVLKGAEKAYVESLPVKKQEGNEVPENNPGGSSENYILETGDGKQYVVNTEGASYPKYMAELPSKKAKSDKAKSGDDLLAKIKQHQSGTVGKIQSMMAKEKVNDLKKGLDDIFNTLIKA